jgi:hypothetical protein
MCLLVFQSKNQSSHCIYWCLTSKTNQHIVFVGFSCQKPKNIKQTPIKPIKNTKTPTTNTQKTMFCKLWASLVASGRVVSKTFVFFGFFWYFCRFFWFLIGFITCCLMFFCFWLEQQINTMCLFVFQSKNQ